MSRDGETKRGPGGNTIGIDGPEPHARSTCAYRGVYVTPCPYCVPDDEWALVVAESLRPALSDERP